MHLRPEKNFVFFQKYCLYVTVPRKFLVLANKFQASIVLSLHNEVVIFILLLFCAVNKARILTCQAQSAEELNARH